MTSHLRHSLTLHSVIGIVGTTIIIGLLILLGAAFIAPGIAAKHTQSRLLQLVDTVESTLAIACFVEDQQLANEVAAGLLKNSEVASVRIRAGHQELARMQRATESSSLFAANGTPSTRSIRSPFDAQRIVGDIEVTPNPEAIQALADAGWRYVGTALLLLLAAVTATVVGYVVFKIVRPITALSDRLHHLDAEQGERLAPPAGHPDNELGLLSRDINELLDRIVGLLHAEQDLRHQHAVDEKKYRDLFDHAESGIFIANADGLLSSYNRAFATQTGLPEDHGPASRLSLFTDIAWQNGAALKVMLGQSLETCTTHGEDLELPGPKGASRWFNLTLTPISDQQVQGTVLDVTQRRQAENSARRAAVTDALTGLPNRTGFEQLLEELHQQDPEASFALLLVDIDGFKQFNDAFGFPMGDHILTAAAARLRACLKQQDIIGRIGGDEFAVCLREADQGAVGAIAQRMIDTMSREFSVNHRPALLGACIGITLAPQDGKHFSALLRNAELALESLRQEGANKAMRLYDARMTEEIELRQTLLADLRLAPYRGELTLHYQPIVDLQTATVVGAEALMRWQHASRGLIPPDTFIPLAEKAGLIPDIGLWCLDTACRQLADWHRAGFPLHLTINVSARQIPDGLPVEMLLATVERYALKPASLGLEITEGVLLTELNHAERWLDSVRAAGFEVYLDDFGTGYSSLSYLKRFRVDKVKIDKSFVRDMQADNSDRALIESVITLADSLNFDVVAEGVEHSEQAGLLRELRCRFGQGYHFSRPVPASEFAATLARLEHLLGS